MVKRAKSRKKRISTRPIGTLMKRTVKELKAARAAAPPKARKYYDARIKLLDGMRKRLYADCLGIWEITNPNA